MGRAAALLQNKRWMVILACMLAAVLAAGGAAWAFYLISDTASIDAISAKADVRIVESHEDGMVVLSAKNAGTTPMFVRVFTLADDGASSSVHVGGDPWSEPDESGWIFCSYALSPGGEACRFATVEEDAETPVSIYAEGVQSEGFSSAQEAFAEIGEVS